MADQRPMASVPIAADIETENEEGRGVEVFGAGGNSGTTRLEELPFGQLH
jgi:hypothetical protein